MDGPRTAEDRSVPPDSRGDGRRARASSAAGPEAVVSLASSRRSSSRSPRRARSRRPNRREACATLDGCARPAQAPSACGPTSRSSRARRGTTSTGSRTPRTRANYDAEIGAAAVSHLLATITAAQLRWVQHGHARCDECGSYSMAGGQCQRCGWTDGRYVPPSLPQPTDEARRAPGRAVHAELGHLDAHHGRRRGTTAPTVGVHRPSRCSIESRRRRNSSGRYSIPRAPELSRVSRRSALHDPPLQRPMTPGDLIRRPMHVATARLPAEHGGAPPAPGLYAWWLADLDALPRVPTSPHPTEPLGLVYVGIAPKDASSAQTIRRRTLEKHLGSALGGSTLRRAPAAFSGNRTAGIRA